MRGCMPTCPGCKHQLPHEELIVHLRYCKWVWSSQPALESRWSEQLAIQVRNQLHDAGPRR